ncbi:MAG: cadherin-like beta sandwich domain-containing protein, partial [Candidatus Izemoplasmataceae bacterium]
ATSEHGTEGQTYTIEVTRTPARTANDLSALEVNVDGSDVLTGANAFDPDTTEYAFRLDNNIKAVEIVGSVDPADGSTMSGDGEKTLDKPINTYTVDVTAENGDVKSYTIEITHQNDNHTITDIAFGGYEEVTFDPDVKTYELGTVPFSTDALDVSVILEDASAQALINGEAVSEDSTYALQEGENTIEVQAQSEYGTKSDTYTYTLTRETPSDDATLETIEAMVEGEDALTGDQAFEKDRLSYEFRVDRSVSEIKLNTERGANQNTTITGDRGTQPLSLGRNTFRISVTAEDGETSQTYMVEVYRENDNSAISDITVDGSAIGFDPDVHSYTLDTYAFDKESIAIGVTTEDPYASVTGDGEQTLSDGTKVYEVQATSEHGTEGQTYTIEVTREAPYTDTDLDDLFVESDGDVLTFDEGPYSSKTNDYTLTLDKDSDIDTIDILSVLKDESHQSVSGDTGTVSLEKVDGEIDQTFTLTVEAQSGDEATYSITVLKETSYSSDASIDKVTLKDSSGKNHMTFDPANAIQEDVTVGYSVSTVYLDVIPSDPNATVSGNESYTINEDSTITIAFDVTAEDGTTESLEYSVSVTREAASSENTLASLEVLKEGEDLLVDNNAFNPSKYAYTLKVDRSVNVVEINALADHEGANITGDINQVFLEPGLERLRVYVQAENGDQRTYNINIEVVNSDIALEDLSVDGHAFDFDPDTFEYDLGEIEHNVDSLTIEALIPEDSYGTLSGDTGEVALEYGANTFSVTAYSEDYSTSVTYQISATRLRPDTNNYLSDLYVKDGEDRLPFHEKSFDKEDTFYQVILDKTSTLKEIEIFGAAENGTTPQGLGTHELNEVAGVIQNDFTVTVTAENGETRDYRIQVVKSDSQDFSDDHTIRDVMISTSNQDYEMSFDPDIKKQNPVTLDYKDSSFFLDIEAHPDATVHGNDLYRLAPGETTTVEFHVEAENKETSVIYEVDVSRSHPDDNSVLDELYVVIDGETSYLNTETDFHQLAINERVDEITIGTVKTDTQSVSGTGTFELVSDPDSFNVVVVAQDGSSHVYTIETLKQSNDASFDSIRIDGEEKLDAFAGGFLRIEDIPFEQDTITLEGIAADSDATVTGNGEHTLETGVNTFEIQAVSELGEAEQVYEIEVIREEACDDATLSDLKVSDPDTDTVLDYAPEFNPSEGKYTVELTLEDSISEVSIEATPTSDLVQSVSGEGLYTLRSASKNTTEIFDVVVVAEDGTTRIYEIHITREVDPEDDVTIDRLALYGQNENYLGTAENALSEFSMSQKDYEITVPYHLESVHLSLTNLNGATVVNDGTHALDDSINVIEFYLTSKSGNVQSDVYTITIIKEDPNDDSSLKDLSIDGTSIEDFDPEKVSYSLTVPYESTDSVHVDAVANDENASVIGDLDDNELASGSNVLSIRVEAENGSHTTYRIEIRRLSTDNALYDLFVLEHELDYSFDEERTRYTLQVPHTQEYVDLEATGHKHASLSGTGIQYLDVGENRVEVYATSQTGVKGEVYEVLITRAPVSTDSTLKSLTVKDAQTNEPVEFGPEFRPSSNHYVINLIKDSAINSLVIEGEENSDFATVGGNGYKVLKSEVDGQYHNVFELTVKAQDGSTSTYTISVYKDVELSDDTSVEELSLTGSDGETYLGTRNAPRDFTPDTHYYEVTVPYHLDSMTLDVKTNSAQVYNAGTKVFSEDEIRYEMYMVSQNGEVQTEDYVIVVNREAAFSDNTLSDIKLNGTTLEGFDPEKTYYEFDIPHGSMDAATFEALTTDDNATLSGDLESQRLEEGKNLHTINVNAQNGDVKTYTVVINSVQSNAYLDSLQIVDRETEEPYSMQFNPETFEYSVNVGRDTDGVKLLGNAQDQKNAAIVGLGNYEIDDDGTKAVINVIAADNETMLTYTVDILRDELPSGNTNLANLSVGGHRLTFDPAVRQYKLSVENGTDTLDVLAEAEDEGSNVRVLGNEGLKEGRNVITVEVEAENGSQSYYQILVDQDQVEDNFLTVMLIISFLVWIITLLVFLIRASLEKKQYRKEKAFIT